LEIESVELPGPDNLCPVERHVVDLELDGTVSGRHSIRERDGAIYGQDAYWPGTTVELLETGYLRDQRVTQVLLYPVQVNPVTGRLRVIKRMLIRLEFQNISGSSVLEDIGQASVDATGDPFEPLYREAIVNWRSAEATSLTTTEKSPSTEPPVQAQAESGPRVKLLVSENGMYRVLGAELAAGGIDIASIDPASLSLTHEGQPVAIRVLGDEDGALDASDSLLFYGRAIDSLYTTENAYWLSWGQGSGLRMIGRDATPDGAVPLATHHIASQHIEKNLLYLSLYPSGTDSDHWYWNFVAGYGAPASQPYPFEVPVVSTDTISVTLQALFHGYSASTGQHKCEISLNDQHVTDAVWPAGTSYLVQAEAPLADLYQGANEITVACGVGIVSGQSDIVFVNRFDLTYPSPHVAIGDTAAFRAAQMGAQEIRITGFSSPSVDLYDVTDSLAPIHLAKSVAAEFGSYTVGMQTTIEGEAESYVAVETSTYQTVDALELVILRDLRSTANGADYVIITHGDFAPALQPLVELREHQGLRVSLIDVQEVYDAFGHGIVSTEAIREFISYAYHHWTPPAPAYVVLVGDGNYDPKGYLGRGEPSYILAYLADVDPWLGETSADNRYVTVHGTDIFPDLFMGRLPAKSLSDAEAMVAKILAYEAAGPGEWQYKVSFVADNPDGAGDFHAFSDAIASGYIPEPYIVEKIYFGVAPYATVAAARGGIIDAFHSGRLLINYTGHGATQVWAGEALFKSAQVADLSNVILPFMVPMTCTEGYYILLPTSSGVDLSSLSETLVRAAGKGAIASFAPGGEGIATGHHFLQEGLYTALFQDGITELGAATTAAKLNLYANTAGYRELIDTYLLMGDPALKLKVLEADVSLQKAVSPTGNLLPGDPINYTLTYANAGPATAFNVEISDPLPAGIVNPVVTFSGPAIALRPGSNLIWDIYSLAPGTGGMITVTATVSTTFGGDLTNVATISTTVPESDETNNTTAQVVTHVLGEVLYLPLVRR
jgi:uncharacterized repeat protein (TIGR01451 family)